MTTATSLRRAGVCLATAVVALGPGACAGRRGSTAPAEPVHVFPVREYDLPSGLRVVIEQDETSVIAGAVLVVEAGQVDDPPGKSGLAHAFEHLLFRAPSAAGPSLWNTFRRLGASSFNATTGPEQTTYYAFVPRASLDELVAALVERMADPARGMNAAVIAKEMPVVAEELRSRDERTARLQALAAVMPAGHPYARLFAEQQQLAALTAEDVRAFAARNYRPERMTLVLAGAIGAEWDARLQALSPAALRGQAHDHHSPVRRTAPAPQLVLAGGTDERMPTLETNVVGPELWLAWPLPPASGVDRFVPAVIARVAQRVVTESLDGSSAGVLDAQFSTLTGSQASALLCRLRLRSGADADVARNEIASRVASLCVVNSRLAGRRTVDGYRHAVREATLRTVFGMESLATRAVLRAGIVHAGSGAQLSQIVSTVQKISVDDVAAFAGRYLAKPSSRSVLLLPDDARPREAPRAGDRPPPTQAQTDPAGGAEPDGKDEADDMVDDAPAAVPAGSSLGARAARMTTLANGLTVIALRRPGLPVVAMVLGFHGDPQPVEVAGVRSALPRVTIWHMPTEPIDRGILHDTALSGDSYSERLNLFSDDAREALQLIAEQPAQLRVHWPSPKLERWMVQEAQTQVTPAGRAARRFREALFGDHPYRQAPTIASIRAVTSTDIEGWIQHVRRPSNGVLVIVGDVDPDQMSGEAARLLSGWHGEAAPLPAPPLPPTVDGTRGPRPRILYTQDERKRSMEIRFGCLLPPIATLQQDLSSDALAQLIELDLRRGLRFKRGASYTPSVGARTLRGGTASVEGILDVENAALPDALEALRRWLEPDRPQPFQPADLERVRGWLARRTVFWNTTNARVASRLFANWNIGWGVEALDAYPGAIASLTAGEVGADLKVCRASAVVSVVGAGPFPADAGSSPAN